VTKKLPAVCAWPGVENDAAIAHRLINRDVFNFDLPSNALPLESVRLIHSSVLILDKTLRWDAILRVAVVTSGRSPDRRDLTDPAPQTRSISPDARLASLLRPKHWPVSPKEPRKMIYTLRIPAQRLLVNAVGSRAVKHSLTMGETRRDVVRASR
jgi:hypothetical protein